MFLYRVLPENDSAIFLLEYENDGHSAQFHAMRIQETVQISFVQNKLPTPDERTALLDWLQHLFQTYFVVNYFQDPLRRCVIHEGLRFAQ